MRFTTAQRYGAPVAAVVAAYTDPDLYATFTGLSKVATPEVLERAADGGTVTLRLRMRFTAPLPSAARRVVDPADLTWVQEEVYDLAAARAQVTFLPDHHADRFSTTGTYAFTAADGDVGATTRTVEGDVRVRVPLVGGQVERALVSGLQEHLGEEQPLVAAWLAAHPRPL